MPILPWSLNLLLRNLRPEWVSECFRFICRRALHVWRQCPTHSSHVFMPLLLIMGLYMEYIRLTLAEQVFIKLSFQKVHVGGIFKLTLLPLLPICPISALCLAYMQPGHQILGKPKDRDQNSGDRKLSRRILTLIRMLFPDHR